MKAALARSLKANTNHNYLLCLANTSDGLTQQVNGQNSHAMCSSLQPSTPPNLPLTDDCVAATAARYATLGCVMEIVCHAMPATELRPHQPAATIANCFGSKICVASSSLVPAFYTLCSEGSRGYIGNHLSRENG